MNEELLNEFSSILKEKNIDINNILSNINSENIDKNVSNKNKYSNFDNTKGNEQKNSDSNQEKNIHSENFNSSNNSSNINYSDIENIIKIKNAFDKASSTSFQNVDLLTALKPFMKDSRKEKIDKYAKLLKFAEVAKMIDLFGGDKK